MIEPDTKDWTWVLTRQCADCGFDASTVRAEQVPSLLRANAAAWPAVLDGGLGDPRRRPKADVWSPLEYACHVRDACRVFDERLLMILTQDDPTFPNWEQDETAVRDRYAEQDPREVATELVAAAGLLADRFEAVAGADWNRTGSRSDGANFTAATFARYFLHDPVHHLYDVTGRTD